MQKYPVRASARAGLSADNLRRLCEGHFGWAKANGERVATGFGAIASLETWPEGKELGIELRMDPNVAAEVQADTIRRYNAFLQEATGYSAKERASRMRKAASHGSTGE